LGQLLKQVIDTAKNRNDKLIDRKLLNVNYIGPFWMKFLLNLVVDRDKKTGADRETREMTTMEKP
jgi:hypothetical protein